MTIELEDITGFLRDELRLDPVGIGPDTPLFSSDLVDSFALVSLLTFLEDRTGIRVRPLDVTLENMDSVARLQRYVARRQGRDGA